MTLPLIAVNSNCQPGRNMAILSCDFAIAQCDLYWTSAHLRDCGNSDFAGPEIYRDHAMALASDTIPSSPTFHTCSKISAPTPHRRRGAQAIASRGSPPRPLEHDPRQATYQMHFEDEQSPETLRQNEIAPVTSLKPSELLFGC